MIRRKVWATMTCCLAVAGVVRSETDATPKASLGKPQANPGYTARGQAPQAGYPQYAGPQYSVPKPQSTFATQSNVRPVSYQQVPPVAIPAPPGGSGPAPSTPMPGSPAPGTPMPMTPGANPMVLPSTEIPYTAPGVAPKQMPVRPDGSAVMSGMPSAAPYSTTNSMFASTGIGSYLDACESGQCGTPYATNANTCCPLPCVWIAPEYISWRAKGMQIPALVTQAPVGSPGTLDDPNTQIIYGNGSILNDFRSGIRVRAGAWLDKTGDCGIDLGFFHLGQARDRFIASSGGDPGLFRPFFNVAPLDANGNITTAVEDAQLVAAAGILSGKVTVLSTSDILGTEVNFRKVLCCDPCNRMDFFAGYRFLRMRDVVSIREELTATDPLEQGAPLGTQITVFDRFETINTFHGGQVGLTGERRIGRFTLGYRGSVALGITKQKTNIDGSTQVTTPDGATTTSQGGLLALSSNIGTYSKDMFSVIPEVGVTLGFDLCNGVRLFGGYNFLYWAHVARAGEQIDRNVNGTLIPNPGGGVNQLQGAPAPLFTQKSTDYYLHGWSVGLEFRW